MPEIQIDDIEVHYEEQGSGEIPIVFIPGGGGSSDSWKRIRKKNQGCLLAWR